MEAVQRSTMATNLAISTAGRDGGAMRFCAISRSFFRGFRPLPATAGQTGGQGRRTAAAPEPRTDGAAIAHGEEPPLARQAGLWCRSSLYLFFIYYNYFILSCFIHPYRNIIQKYHVLYL